MPFFAPLPEPEPEPEPPGNDARRFFAYPWQEPEHLLPGLGQAGLVLGRSETTALQLAVAGVYPQGLALAVRARFHPEHVDDVWGPPRRAAGAMGDLRFGLQWPDGSRVEAGQTPGGEDPAQGGYSLDVPYSGGGDLGYDWRVWLWPLPEPGRVTVHVMWERRGIPETAAELDLAPIIAWAAGSVELWPLPDPPQEGSWRAYAPLARGRP